MTRSVNRGWVARAAELHGELTSIAGHHPAWWLLAGGAAAAEPWHPRPGYVVSDAEPGADTFIGSRRHAAGDPLRDAIARARAARDAIRALDGTLPDQPLAVTLGRAAGATRLVPSTLDVAAFAIGRRCVVAAIEDPGLPALLAAAARGAAPPVWRGAPPFVCVSLGDDPIEVARHGHRRAWRDGAGPWLGLGTSGELATVSTCHLVVDGFGHAALAARIHAAVPGGAPGDVMPDLPALAPVPGAIPLGVAWQPLGERGPRALPLAYATAVILHGMARRDARFSPTIQIPVAPGRLDDPHRLRRRAMPAAVSVRMMAGGPEPFEVFEARARAVLARETSGVGLCARLVHAARAAPTPLAWKRRGFSTARPAWLDRVSDVLGGRACVSRIRPDAPLPPACAVSSPARHATARDPLGACVVTVIDDGDHAAITVCGSGVAGDRAAARTLLNAILTAASSILHRST